MWKKLTLLVLARAMNVWSIQVRRFVLHGVVCTPMRFVVSMTIQMTPAEIFLGVGPLQRGVRQPQIGLGVVAQGALLRGKEEVVIGVGLLHLPLPPLLPFLLDVLVVVGLIGVADRINVLRPISIVILGHVTHPVVLRKLLVNMMQLV